MDLIDLIADSKTDSLPPGFLRSIKIKYRQEASNVFPKEKLASLAEQDGKIDAERVKTAATDKSTPSFMDWRVPSRLVTTRPQAPIPPTPATGGVVVMSKDDERPKLSSRLSAMTLRSVSKLDPQPVIDDIKHLPRVGSVKSARKSPMAKLHPSLPKIQTPHEEKEQLPAPLSREKATMSAQGKRVLNKIMAEAEKGNGKATNSSIIDAVDKWLATATDKEREVALKFFSTLAGTRAENLTAPMQKYHTHTEGNCKYCDGDRINETLDTLAKRDTIFSRSKQLRKREPNIGTSSFYQKPRAQLSSRVRRSYQTWHHLPVYNYNDGVANKSAMFTQPHKYIGRHFSIHPEWGLHTGIKPAAY